MSNDINKNSILNERQAREVESTCVLEIVSKRGCPAEFQVGNEWSSNILNEFSSIYPASEETGDAYDQLANVVTNISVVPAGNMTDNSEALSEISKELKEAARIFLEQRPMGTATIFKSRYGYMVKLQVANTVNDPHLEETFDAIEELPDYNGLHETGRSINVVIDILTDDHLCFVALKEKQLVIKSPCYKWLSVEENMVLALKDTMRKPMVIDIVGDDDLVEQFDKDLALLIKSLLNSTARGGKPSPRVSSTNLVKLSFS